MCGIGGFQGDYPVELLGAFAHAMSHRGPDHAGEWHSPCARVGLAHQRLSIIDVSPLGHQPMIDDEGGAVIVFNGEIYNFRELRRGLEREGCTFRSQSDTEVLLALYRSRGESMLPLLNGIFAFAIYDTSGETLLLACDEMAVKPLYVSEGPRGFVFASELKALVNAGAVSGALDIATLYRTLGFLWSPGGATPISGVRRLGPGEALRVRHGQVVRRWTWAESSWIRDPLPATAHELTRRGSDDVVRKVRDGLRTAVHRQMVADVPVGAFLSGGLDSSAVVAFAREDAPAIDCFTIDSGARLDAGVNDDLPYGRRVAAHLGVKLHEVVVDAARMAADFERMVYQLDEPLADPAPLNVLYISRLARQLGTKVLLSGAGGDDIFSGYRRHRALAQEWYWAGLPTPIRLRLRQVTTRLNQGGSWRRRITKSLAHADASPDDRLIGYFLWADAERLRELFTPDCRAALSGEALVAPLRDYLATLPAELPPLQRMLALEQRFFLADHNLLYTDKMAMAAGVEVRVPFLDKDLVRLANALPPALKQRGAESKWVLKKAMEPLLPREAIYRPKTGFGAPLRRWLHRELRELVADILSADALRARGLFDPQAVARLIADDRAGRVDAAYTILGLMCIEMWCRHFLTTRAGRGAACDDSTLAVTA